MKESDRLKSQQIAFFLVAALFVFGCSDRSNPEGALTAKSSVDGLVIDIGGMRLTTDRLCREIDFNRYLYTSLKGKVNPKVRNRFESGLTNSVVNRFRVNALLCIAAKKENVEVGGAQIDEVVRRKYARSFCKKGESFSNFVVRVEQAGFKREFEQQFAADVLNESYIKKMFSAQLSISDKAVEDALTRIREYNRRIDQTNATVRVRAENIRRKAIMPGADFARLADAYSEDPDKNPGGLLPNSSAPDFEEMQETWDVISKLKEGEISPVIDNEFGSFIYRLNGNVERDADNEMTSADFARIWLRKALRMEEYSAADLRRRFESERRRNLMNSVISNIESTVEIKLNKSAF